MEAQDVNASQAAPCYTAEPESAGVATVRLLDLERALFNEAKRSNMIKVIRKTASASLLNEVSRQYDFVFGADGANSAVRKWMNVQSHSKDWGFGVTLTYQVSSKRRATTVQEQHQGPRITQKNTQNRFRGFRTRDNAFYVGIQVTGSEYLNFESGTTTLDKCNRESAALATEAIRFYGFPLPRDLSSVEVSAFPLRSAVATQTRKKMPGGTLAVLVGDAYSNAHYFGGIGVNMGLTGCRLLATGDMDQIFLSGKDLDFRKGFPASVQYYSRTIKQVVSSQHVHGFKVVSLPPIKNPECIPAKVRRRLALQMGWDIRHLSPLSQCFVLWNAYVASARDSPGRALS